MVIESERKRQIFLECHFNDIGHHLGQKKTVHKIQSKYYWLGIVKDVVDWVMLLLDSFGQDSVINLQCVCQLRYMMECLPFR